MEDLKLINSSFAYVEMGAGKGNLTHLVKQISQSKQSVLIDKQKCFRNKVCFSQVEKIKIKGGSF